MSAQIETPTRENESEFPKLMSQRIATGRVWETQTTHRQQRVYQVLVQMCQELLRRERQDEGA